MLESKIQRDMQKVIKNHGGFVFKTHGDLFLRVGIPDLIACIKGKFIGVECKVDETKYDTTDAQKVVGQQIQNAGGIWLSCDDPKILDKFLNNL